MDERNQVREYQTWLRDRLSEVLQVEVRCEWAAFPGIAMYSPRVDVAVGPFSIEEGTLGDDYDRLLRRHRRFIGRLRRCHDQNVRGSDPSEARSDLASMMQENWNARCLMAIEIENASSRKHLMGSAINASALGRVGIAVGWNEDWVRRFIRMRRYLRALGDLRKNTFKTTNLLILSRDQLTEAVVVQ